LVFANNFNGQAADLCGFKYHKILRKFFMYDTAQLLAQLHQQTERHLQIAIGKWQSLPEAALTQKPAPDKWSAAQCLEHLNIYGRHYLPAMEKGMQSALQHGGKPARHFRSGWLGAYFTKIMLPEKNGNLKVRMKAPKQAEPAPNPDPHQMLAEFIAQQEHLVQLLDRAAQADLNRIRIPTSLSSLLRLKLGDTLLFYTAHLERHVLQAERACGGR
jgi:hypothetical protein